MSASADVFNELRAEYGRYKDQLYDCVLDETLSRIAPLETSNPRFPNISVHTPIHWTSRSIGLLAVSNGKEYTLDDAVLANAEEPLLSKQLWQIHNSRAGIISYKNTEVKPFDDHDPTILRDDDIKTRPLILIGYPVRTHYVEILIQIANYGNFVSYTESRER